MLDYKTSTTGVCVDLSNTPSPDCIKPSGYTNVATVSDSTHNDHVVGNAQTNFLSCSGGEDYLQGNEGTDNYVVKKACRKAIINNFDIRQKVDLLYIEETFQHLRLQKDNNDLKIISSHGTPTVSLSNWFNSSENQHLGVRTVDGITLRINSSTVRFEPYEISKDPTECQCTHAGCDMGLITYDLSNDPWQHVVRFQLKSSHYSYKIYGNRLNNYLDPGAGNGYNYQHLEGRSGSDTYVINHGYGEFNEINNFADDNKTDFLQLGMEFDDIRVYFHGRNDVFLASNTRPDSLSVRILDYFRGGRYQHLQIISADKVVLYISKQYPYRKIIAVDRRIIDSPQNIDPDTNNVIATAEDLKGSLTYANNLTGSNTTREIEGGAQADILSGGETGTILDGKQGNDTIYGGAGNDIIFGGDGDDIISAGIGDDNIYGGSGSDFIDGGSGIDTIAFKGDGFLRKGVTVDLKFGYGKGDDAEGDIYKSIENVYGTIHDDFLIGSGTDNKLYGLDGDDTLASHGGDDKLVGGEGKDLYLLYKAWGLKVIDNYANDTIEDTLSFAHLNSTDVCIFLVSNDLHIQVNKSNLASVLYHGELLTVVITNWKVGQKYRHLQVLFNDTLWRGFALSAIAERFERLGNSVSFIENRADLGIVAANATDVSLSWNQTNGLLSQLNTELFLVHFKQHEPNSLAKKQVGDQTSLSVSSLNATSHYVFALALTKCNTTIAVSHTLITYGRERSCPTAEVPHSAVQYTPSTSTLTPAHGTIATVKCNSGYDIEIHQPQQNNTCLDQEWIPSLPVCKRIKQCPVLTKPSNGEISTNGHDEGSKAYYVCHKGFVLNGPKERTCVEEAWDGTVPNCQALSCPRPPPIDQGSFIPCDYIKHTTTYGTKDNPIEGYCVKLKCNVLYLPSYVLHGETHSPRWESDWEIPQGGRACSDGKWIGYVDDTCEPIARLVNVEDLWHKKSGTLQLWLRKGGWTFVSFTPAQSILHLSCKSVGIDEPQYVKSSTSGSRRLVTCSKLRLTQPKPTRYEGRLEVLNHGNWEGVCVTETGAAARQSASVEICEALGFNYRSAIVSINTGWTDNRLVCSPIHPRYCPWPFPIPILLGKRQTIVVSRTGNRRCRLEGHRGQCGTMVRCRQRCTDSFPVPHGDTTCTGYYEDDTCTVHCDRDYKLTTGISKVYCKGGAWTKQDGTPAISRCENIDTLFRDDLQRLVRENSRKSRRDLAIFLRNYLDRHYPRQYWVVTVYDPVKGFEKHTFLTGGRIGYSLRYHGVNYVVYRYPKYAARSPKVPISRVIGSVTGSNAETVWGSIRNKFIQNRQSYAFIHVIRKLKGHSGTWFWRKTHWTNRFTAKSASLPSQNYFYGDFSHVIVIAVAPY